jgi:AraC-like DNA-binding protein
MVGTNKLESSSRLWFYQDAEICLHHFQYSGGRLDCLPHTHDEYNIVFCLNGQIEYSVRNGWETLQPGDAVIINPGEVHCSNYGQGPADATGLTVHMTENAMKRLIHRMKLPVDVEHSSLAFFGTAHDPALLSFSEELVAEVDQRQSGFELVAQALIVQLVVHLLRRCVHPVARTPQWSLPRQLPSWQMVRALEYMNATGKNSFRLTDMCSTVGTSATRFIQLFKNSAINGMNPHSFYNHLVVHKAKRLLLQPGSSVKEVAFELGFQNESHFCKVFRSCAGQTPGNFRISVPQMGLT